MASAVAWSSLSLPRKDAGLAQVGADDDQSPIAVPDRFQDLGHRLGIGPADQEWNDGEGVEHDLEEGEAGPRCMVAIVCLIVDVHLGESKRLLDPRRRSTGTRPSGVRNSAALVVARPLTPGIWQVPSKTTRSIWSDQGTIQA